MEKDLTSDSHIATIIATRANRCYQFCVILQVSQFFGKERITHLTSDGYILTVVEGTTTKVQGGRISWRVWGEEACDKQDEQKWFATSLK